MCMWLLSVSGHVEFHGFSSLSDGFTEAEAVVAASFSFEVVCHPNGMMQQVPQMMWPGLAACPSHQSRRAMPLPDNDQLRRGLPFPNDNPSQNSPARPRRQVWMCVFDIVRHCLPLFDPFLLPGTQSPTWWRQWPSWDQAKGAATDHYRSKSIELHIGGKLNWKCSSAMVPQEAVASNTAVTPSFFCCDWALTRLEFASRP